MKKAHPKNERIKRKYLQWLETAKGMTPATADQVAGAISAFEKSTNGKDFAAFHIEQPQKFQRDLKAAINAKTGKPLAKSTIRSRLMAVKAFFKWLADQQGYKSRISHSDCEYFNVTANDRRIATARRERPVPSVEQLHHVIAAAPHETAIQKRDRALIAFTLLTGMRDAAIASLPLGKVNLERREVFQDARLVKTKNAKTMTTYFFPVGGEAEAIFIDWVRFLRDELLFADADPLFPKTETGVNEAGFLGPIGLSRLYWRSADAIRRIFRERFEAAGLPYFHPHSLRHTLMQVAFRKNLDPEALKAWSQNLAHENLATSLNSYGKIQDQRTAEIMAGLALADVEGASSRLPPEVLEWMAKELSQRKI
ncbi:site-specific integrase [Hyphomonas johnsonii]|uniref:Phage integrase family protein n=1 Tax=Hyphomonas johnsonii MHS-2 TaxID=1280950 RepID=A0A059FNV2_9PROT|nr:tyrosine-type recombinase/integrase [Hyphomonas johnsonii]KCZ92201.1 phage integrase family protein [Hyphomonas johnsonii MHS-2]